MLHAIGMWFAYQVPWQVWAVLGIGVVLTALLFFQRLLGWERAGELVAALAAAIAGAVALDRAGQKGYDERKAEEEAATATTLKELQETKDAVAKKSDADVDRDNAPWVQPDPKAGPK